MIRRTGIAFFAAAVAAFVIWAAVAGGVGAQQLSAGRRARKSVRRFTGSRPPANARAGDVWINPNDEAELVFVPAGEFLMGLSSSDLQDLTRTTPGLKRENLAAAMPQHRVYLRGYWIGKHEVTVAQYRRFCKATGRTMPDPPRWRWQDNHPIVRVSWFDAKAYADWAGVSLPTEAQWEKAARGTDGRRHVWGDRWPPPPKVGNFADEAFKLEFPQVALRFGSLQAYNDGYACTAPVGSFPAGASPYGCLDMVGNAWEWCADWYGRDYYTQAPAHNPGGPMRGVARCLRGSWYDADREVFLCAFRLNDRPETRDDYNGFRCVRGP